MERLERNEWADRDERELEVDWTEPRRLGGEGGRGKRDGDCPSKCVIAWPVCGVKS